MALTDPQAATAHTLRSINKQASGTTPTSPPPTTQKIAYGSNSKMPNEKTRQDFGRQSHAPNLHQPISKPTLMIFTASATGDHTPEHGPKESTYTVYSHPNFTPPWEQHIHYNATRAPYVTTPMDSLCASSQSSELLLTLLALPSTSNASTTNLDTRTLDQSTSAPNMVIPSKEIASAAPIVSPGIVCWNATCHASHDPCHICPSICQIDNLTPSSLSTNTLPGELSKSSSNLVQSKHMHSSTPALNAPYCPQASLNAHWTSNPFNSQYVAKSKSLMAPLLMPTAQLSS
uniref:Uncharacterized protein n=1 Tax=Romanomermis culicivorax TaxID=13658 RepID=A0A915IVE2_ROMCU